jgi:Na+/phosphate symporter
MLISWLAIVVLVLGALVYALAANPKASEMGRIAFFVGLLWTVYLLAGHAVRIP